MSQGKEILNFREAYLSLISLSVYRGLLSDGVLKKFNELLKYISCGEASLEGFIENYCGFYHELEKNNTKRNLKIYIVESVIYNDNPFTAACENNYFCDIDKNMIEAVSKDLEVLKSVSEITSFEVKAYAKDKFCTLEYELKLIESLPNWDNGSEYFGKTVDLEPVISVLLSGRSWRESVEELARFHKDKGTGMFIKYKAFVWGG